MEATDLMNIYGRLLKVEEITSIEEQENLLNESDSVVERTIEVGCDHFRIVGDDSSTNLTDRVIISLPEGCFITRMPALSTLIRLGVMDTSDLADFTANVVLSVLGQLTMLGRITWNDVPRTPEGD